MFNVIYYNNIKYNNNQFYMIFFSNLYNIKTRFINVSQLLVRCLSKQHHSRIFYDKIELNYGSKHRKMFKQQMNYVGFVQDHHCIPKQHRNHQLMKVLNYNINKYDNIAIMPNKKGIQGLNLHPNRLIHDGGHNQYNIYVKQQLDYIYQKYKKEQTNQMDGYKYEFWLLQKHLKKNMDFNEDQIPWK